MVLEDMPVGILRCETSQLKKSACMLRAACCMLRAVLLLQQQTGVLVDGESGQVSLCPARFLYFEEFYKQPAVYVHPVKKCTLLYVDTYIHF